MRRTTLALLLLLASGPLTPSQAQWWGGGWAEPGGFVVVEGAPRPGWGGPGSFGPPRFRPAGWGWGRPWWWWREQRRRRLEARWRWMEADARVDRPRAPKGVAFQGWAWGRPAPAQGRPEAGSARTTPSGDVARRAETAVAMLPPTSPRLVQPRPTSVHRVLAVAAMIRPIPAPARRAATVLPAVVRPPERPAQVRGPRPVAVTGRTIIPAARALPIRPAALQNQPAAASPAPTSMPAPAPQPGAASQAEVPVAPLD